MTHESAHYPVREIEQRWQKRWQEHNVFATREDKTKPKYYVLEMFPYPSGKIHMGHLRNYTIGDVVARYKKAQGYNVLHPMGWDAFGLPAENAAIAHKVHPSVWTYENIAHMREQLKSLGISYDWQREVTTCDPGYYQHEQKMFLDFLKKGIAYQKEAMVNWDPVDHTVLANEQVIDGKGWRSGAAVERRSLRQWFLRITDYAEPLLEGIKHLDRWPERVRLMQERWIGRSEGLTIHFGIEGKKETLEIYTTRPDTLFGAAFCAISPHHPLAVQLAEGNKGIQEFIQACNQMGMAEEVIEKAEKKGIDTGLKIQHPFKEGALPLYIANFVLMEYGAGAIFGCPAHDQRDLDFALKYHLPVYPVICPTGQDKGDFTVGKEAYTGDGVLIHSDFLDGLTVGEAKEQVILQIEKRKQGKRTVNYRLRDWGISRQRYWGCPIPVIYCKHCGTVPVPEAQLPVTLPHDVAFDKPGNPLVHHPTWKYVDCFQCGKPAERETDTFDTFFESSWYFARFCAPTAPQGVDKEACRYWLPVDQYIGGIEHAVLHLLYARFFTLILKQCGYLEQEVPFAGLLTQGMVCHETYKDEEGNWCYPEEVEKQKQGQYVHITTRKPVTVGRVEKMSKSKKNVVDPAPIIAAYGADTARLFMLSDSPPERDLEWSETGIEGAWRYISRLWRMVIQGRPLYISKAAVVSSPGTLEGEHLKVKQMIHKTIAAVTQDLDAFHFNRAVARIRELTNTLAELDTLLPQGAYLWKEGIGILIKLMQPMLPHVAEELWAQSGYTGYVYEQSWPVADPAFCAEDTVTIAVQINGKLKSTFSCAKDSPKTYLEEKAMAQKPIQLALEGITIKKVIVVPNRVVNVVI